VEEDGCWLQSGRNGKMKINCPKCDTLIDIPFEVDGVVCPGCGTVFRIKVEIILEEMEVEKYEKEEKEV